MRPDSAFKPSKILNSYVGEGLLHLISLNLALGLVYLFLGRVALLLAIPPGYAMAIYPPAGLAVGMVLAGGYRLLPGVALGSFLLNCWISWETQNGLSSISLGLAAAIATGALLQAAFGRFLVLRMIGTQVTLESNTEILRFMLSAGSIACLVNSSVGVGSLWLLGFVPTNAILGNWATWWMGDTLGVVVFSPICLILFGRPKALWRSRRYSVMLPQLLSLVLVTFGFVLVRDWEQRQLTYEFHYRAETVANALVARLDFHVETQKNIANIFSNFETVSRIQMQRSVIDILAKHSELQAIEWAPLVSRDERREFEARQAAAFGVDYVISEKQGDNILPAPDRDVFLPITYVEPLIGNELVLGLDVFSHRNRRISLQRARSSGLPVATEPLRLIQDPLRRLSCLVLTAAYGNTNQHTNNSTKKLADEELGEFKGVIISALRPADVLAAVQTNVDREGIDVRLVDTEYVDGVYTDTLTVKYHAYQWETSFDFAGRTLHFVAQPSAIYLSQHTPWVAWISLASGMLFCGFVGMYLLTTSSARFQI
ncbi:MAG: CHASE domain-containing protein [Undibacterium sp.]|nr:CHASE domain-containing protein [Undibacterium sp.]